VKIPFVKDNDTGNRWKVLRVKITGTFLTQCFLASRQASTGPSSVIRRCYLLALMASQKLIQRMIQRKPKLTDYEYAEAVYDANYRPSIPTGLAICVNGSGVKVGVDSAEGMGDDIDGD
jgi:hypothetical protein